MSEELKDEAICMAHSSVECDQKCTLFYEEPKRGCKLELTIDNPYRSTCEYRLVIKAPPVPVETNPVPLPEIPELKPITTMPVKLTKTEELPEELPF
jgi:hypothetical protein